MKIFNKWTGLRLEITQYCQENNISANDFRFLGIYEWQNAYDRLLKKFVEERYAKEYGLHWSNISGAFREDVDRIYTFQEGYENNASYEWIEKLSEIVKCETVYLFLEESKQAAKYWIAECNSAVVHLIIDVNPTDYYITNKKFDWLITEDHHDIVQFIGKGLDADIIKSVCTK